MESTSVSIFVTLLTALMVDLTAGKKVPPNCCMPDKFEVFLGQEGGTNGGCSGTIYSYEYRFYYDYHAKKWGVISGKEYFTGDWSGHMVTEDYSEHHITRGGMTPRSTLCRIEEIDPTWDIKRICVPEDAEYVETVTLGYMDEVFTYDTFRWEDEIIQNNELFKTYITTGITEDCEFINEIIIWKGDKFNNTVYTSFFNLKEEWGRNHVYEDISYLFGTCEIGDLDQLFDPYRSNTIRYLARRVRDAPLVLEPEVEEAGEGDDTQTDGTQA